MLSRPPSQHATGGRCVKCNKKTDSEIFRILYQSIAIILNAALHILMCIDSTSLKVIQVLKRDTRDL